MFPELTVIGKKAIKKVKKHLNILSSTAHMMIKQLFILETLIESLTR